MTVDIASLVSDNLDIWTTAVERKSGAGRGGGKRISLYGIERLRPLIVDLAVRGKLTSQQPYEEPAAVALAKLAKARRCKIEAGHARQPKALSLLPADLPTLPEGWEWTQLGTLAEINPSNSADDHVDASFVPMTLVSTKIDGAHETEPRKWGEIKKGFTHFAEGDIGLAKITPCFENGKAAIFGNLVNGIGAGTTELHVARPWSDDVNRRYLLLTMKTESYLHQGEAGMTGTAGQKRVTRTHFESSPFPLPPLAEQQRVVAKVDELMALCDALQAESAEAVAAHQALVEALLDTLTASTDATDLVTNWARLSAHFDTLFTTEASINALKRTILNLAVRGKLVNQTVGDEPAAQILKDIKVAKANFIGGTKARKGAENSLGIPLNQLFELPEGWVWAPLGELVSLLGDGIHGTPIYDPNGEYYFINGNNLSDGNIVIKEETKRVSFDQYQKHRKLLGNSTVLVSINGTIGNVAFFKNEHVILGKSACYFNLFPGVLKEYVLKIIKSTYFLDYAYSQATGSTIKNVSLKTMRDLPVPLPPLAEQGRIVDKVDELMALCNALYAEIASATETQRHLANSIVEKAAA